MRLPPGNSVAPAGSNRSGGGGNEAAGAFDGKGRLGDPASRQAVTRVNAEQAPIGLTWEPTRRENGEGRRHWGTGGHTPRSDANRWSHRGIGDGMPAHGDPTQHGKPRAVEARDLQPDSREGQAGPGGVADRPVVPRKPGNAGGGKLQLTTAFSPWVRVPPQHESSWLRSYIRPRLGATRAGKART